MDRIWATGRRTVSLKDLETLFEGGKRQLARQRAVEELMELTGLGKSACYTVLKPDGRFAANLVEQDGLDHICPTNRNRIGQ